MQLVILFLEEPNYIRLPEVQFFCIFNFSTKDSCDRKFRYVQMVILNYIVSHGMPSYY